MRLPEDGPKHVFPRHGPPSTENTCVFIGSLPSNGCPNIVESVTPGMFLPSRCLAMVTYVTIFSNGL
jgi:hypothetical protein